MFLEAVWRNFFKFEARQKDPTLPDYSAELLAEGRRSLKAVKAVKAL
jgi:hypothetical protein